MRKRKLYQDCCPDCKKEMNRRKEHLGKSCKSCSNMSKNISNYPESYKISKKDRLITKRKTRWAIDSGRIKRKPCDVCGNEKSEAHHEDYTKPYLLHWLCRKQHMMLHKYS